MQPGNSQNRCRAWEMGARIAFAWAIAFSPACHAFNTALYFPLTVGSQWAYSSTLNGSLTLSVTGTTVINGLKCTVLHGSNGHEVYMLNDANGVRECGALDPSVDIDGVGSVQALQINIPPEPQLPADVTLPLTYPASGVVTLTYQGVGTFSLNYAIGVTPAEFVSVTVPAGTFPNALRVQTEHRIYGTITGPGGSANVDIHQDISDWLVSGVGEVKSTISTVNRINGQITEITNDAVELVSYNVVPPDTTPDAFSIPAQTGLVAGSTAMSGTITISGINTATPVSVSGGSYSVNEAAFTSATGSLLNGDRVRVQLDTSPNTNTQACATLTIGGIASSFCATTGSLTMKQLIQLLTITLDD